jgi:hypothetical protein
MLSAKTAGRVAKKQDMLCLECKYAELQFIQTCLVGPASS